jgi:glycosyltransferase involved in cell wall biosynthesis
MINGIAQFSKNLAEGLTKKGHEVLVLAPSFEDKPSIKTDESGFKIAYLSSRKLPIYPDMVSKIPESKEIWGLKMPRIFYKNGMHVSFTPYQEIKKVLQDFQPDIIHNQTPGPIAIAVLTYVKKYKIPFVSTGHAYPDNLTAQVKWLGPVKKPIDSFLRWYFGIFIKTSDYATMPTEIAVRDLAPKPGRIFKVKVEAMSNGIDLSRFKPGKAPKEIYKKYSLSPDKPTVLYVGRVDREKSLDVLLSAFAETIKKVPDAQLVIVGDGKDMDHLKDLAKELNVTDKTHFLGRIVGDDLPKLYKAGAVFAITSETETQSIVLMEALASGLPAVAVNAGAVKELVKNNQNGFLKKPKSIKPIAGALAKILQNPDLRQKFSNESLKIAKTHDISHTLAKVEEIYTKVLESKR